MMFGVEDYRPEGGEHRRERVDRSRRGLRRQGHVDRLLRPAGRRADVARSHGDQCAPANDPPDAMGSARFSLAGAPPPGTGDVHLSVISEMKVDGALIVTTPQRVALADVVRGVHMCRNEKVNIPILGLVENMAWFTPAELPDNRYYIFGEGEAARIAEQKAAPTGQHTSDSQRVGSGGQRTARHLRKLAGRKILRPFGRRCRRRTLQKQMLTITFPFTMTIRCAQGVSFLRRKVDKLFIRPGQAVRRIDSFSAAESWTFQAKKI